jgi:hypothetical protein
MYLYAPSVLRRLRYAILCLYGALLIIICGGIVRTDEGVTFLFVIMLLCTLLYHVNFTQKFSR